MSGTVHTIGIVDDHALILDGLSGWLGTNAPDLDVVARATTWVDLARHPAFPTDLVLMDLQLKEPISVEARIRICRSVGARVVVLSALDAPDNVRRALEAGAAAFVSKSSPADELLAVIRDVLAPASSGAVAWDEPARPAARGVTAPLRFTEEEEETLRLYASGHSPVEVAMILGTNIQAVKNSLERVREQYASEGRQADRKQDLMLRAAEDGYLA
jgi:DNA-binding NarL/FixJ family response regulator